MGNVDTKNLTCKQVSMNRNPSGKGGFTEHPENISDGRWSKENSYSYWMNFFKTLSINEFKEYKGKHPEMTMAALGAYARVAKSVDDRWDFQEVANRTEGMPKQPIEHSGKIGSDKTEEELDEELRREGIDPSKIKYQRKAPPES